MASILESGAEHTDCRALVPEDHPYLVHDRAHSLLAIELLAQAAAVHRRLTPSPDDPEAQGGFLVGSSVVLGMSYVAAGSSLRVRVRREASLGRLLRFCGEVMLESAPYTLIASGEVSVALDVGTERGEPTS